MNILLGVTGSVAATLTPKIVRALQELGEVKVVATNSGIYFIEHCNKSAAYDGYILEKGHEIAELYLDEDEWFSWNEDFSLGKKCNKKWQKKGDPVVHIDLREWADVLVIAPLTMNSLAKIANGFCDNLLTSIVRAWDFTKPIILAPSANTMMWQSNFTEKHLKIVKEMGMVIVSPQEKMLACGTTGEGALAEIDDIFECVKDQIEIKGNYEREIMIENDFKEGSREVVWVIWLQNKETGNFASFSCKSKFLSEAFLLGGKKFFTEPSISSFEIIGTNDFNYYTEKNKEEFMFLGSRITKVRCRRFETDEKDAIEKEKREGLDTTEKQRLMDIFNKNKERKDIWREIDAKGIINDDERTKMFKEIKRIREMWKEIDDNKNLNYFLPPDPE
jgi:phosphopantothenoylcysteine decarboxylase